MPRAAATVFVVFVFFPKLGGRTDDVKHFENEQNEHATGSGSGTTTTDPNQASPEASIPVFARVAECALVLSLLGLFSFKVLDILNNRRRRSMSKRLDLANLPPNPWSRYMLHTLFGRRLLQPAVP